jgi:hypothetical protein
VIIGVTRELIADGVVFITSSRPKTIQEVIIADLKIQIAPRDLLETEISRISEQIGKFKDRDVVIQSYMGDGEGHRLLFLVGTIFGRADFKPRLGYWYPADALSMDLLIGMEIAAPPEQKDFADLLVSAFEDAAVGIRGPKWYPLPAGSPVTIHIGVKPFSTPFPLQRPSQ